MNTIISPERKQEMLLVIRQMKEFWTRTYLRFDNLSASREIVFTNEPACLWIRDKSYNVERVTLDAEPQFGEYSVFVTAPDGRRDLLSEVVRTSTITEEMDSEICMALSFLGANLGQQQMQAISKGPSDNELLNMMVRFL